MAGESLQKDRLTKSALYTGGVIPEYVIVNVEEQCLEVHRDPDPAARRYRSLATLSAGHSFESATVPAFALPGRLALRVAPEKVGRYSVSKQPRCG